MPRIYLDTLRINAEIQGPSAGPGVVFLHALGTDLSIWSQVVACLPPALRILRIDHRGHGKSDVPAPPYTMGALIRDTEQVIEHFGLKDTVVVGVSLGGLVAQGLAVKRLDLVRGMVLSNTAAKIGTPDMWQDRIVAIRAGGTEPYADGAMERMFGRNFRKANGMAAVRDLLTSTAPDGWIGCAAAISGTDFFTPTAGLNLPTLVIAGTNDGSTPPDLVRETAELIKGHQFHLMRGVGHLPMVEKPDDYATLLVKFLKSIGHI